MISVIVPVYNVEKYLEECLDSIQNQTYSDIEVILVNDGSTDKSKEICGKYCKQDNRFQLLNQENQGLSAARNSGVAASTGEFIAFVDSDDIILPNYLETLMHYMRQDVDIVESQFTISKEEFLAESYKELTILFEGNSQEAVKIFPKHVLNVNEDVYCGIGMLKYIRKIIKIDYKGYYYRQRQASIMHRTFTPKNLDIFTVSDKLIELYSDREELLPYIASFLVHLATMHYQDYIRKGNPYAKVYNQKLAEYVTLTKKNQELARKSRMIRLYNICPKYYNSIIFPVYHFVWKLKNGIKEVSVDE